MEKALRYIIAVVFLLLVFIILRNWPLIQVEAFKIATNSINGSWGNFSVVLTSTFLSAGLTSYVNWLIQSNNYKNDFYKKVLDKRLQVYEQVVKTIGLLNFKRMTEDGKMGHAFLLSGEEEYDEFVTQLAYSTQEGIWLSSESAKLLRELSIFLMDEIENKKSEEVQLESLAIKNMSKITDLRNKIQKQIYTDFHYLYKVEEFIKEKHEKKI